MAIYDFKEFLTIDDVAEYLTDKGVAKLYPIVPYAKKKLDRLLSEWIKLQKLKPLYPFDHYVMQYKIDYGFEISESNAMEFAKNIVDDFERVQKSEQKKFNYNGKRINIGKKFINDYLIFGRSIWDDLCVSNNASLGFLDWCRFYNDENNQHQWEILYCDDTPQEYREFTIFRDKVVFLKSELETIFNPKPKEAPQTFGNFGTASITIVQPSIETLNQRIKDKDSEITALNAQIRELEKIMEQSKTATTPIFDSQDGYTYPPELDMAIKIWIEIYQTDNIPKHLTNHSDKFTQACKNLGFSFTENAVKTRLKKVTTPQSQKEKTKNKNSLK